MASSSAAVRSSQSPPWKYDVFLSFRGEDTRNTFTGHLYEGLKNRGIYTFQDDKRLEHGTSISEELLKAIQGSQVAVIVFSENYAASSWCLDELVKIMECKEEYGQTVIPVFYDVDPSTIRYQKDSFAKAFDKHGSRCKDDDVERLRQLQRWRTALTAAANLRGYDIRQGNESENIQQIVNQISSKLCKATSLSSLGDVVGINTHLQEVKSLLKIEISDVRIVGIWGMGGVGKTTIARAIFDTLSDQFEAACFLADVKENEKRHQLHYLQNTLLSELLRRKEDYVSNKYDGKCMIPRRLWSKKVLVVLDDIDHRDHLEYLAGDLGWFGSGSRVVVTTRDSHLIEKGDAIYEVTTLLDHEAMRLFNQHAFKKEVPDERFKKLSMEVVNHAKGLPLALKVWGSLLHKRGLTEWRRAVDRIKKNSSSEIVDKLKISYDGLEQEEQQIFLDLACFFRGDKTENVMQILRSCGFEAGYGLDILIEKSLVIISRNDTIEMHDLIQDMGKYVVNMQKDPGERSRIWLTEDFEELMINNTGTKALEAIWVRYSERPFFSKEAMTNMKRLRILYVAATDFYSRTHYGPNYDGFIEYLPNCLCWFAWNHYPWESLPEKFEPKRLAHLDLSGSSLHHLWTGTKHLPSLRTVDLRNSRRLTRTPDFTGIPNLEYLDLQLCSNLEEIHDSLGTCNKLIHLNLSYCESLKRFPCINVESLEYLNQQGCTSLEKFPEILGRLKLKLDIFKYKYGFGIRELPSYIQHLTHLTELDLSRLRKLVALPDRICRLKSLVSLNVSGCSKLESLPEEIGDLENLENLNAEDTLISQPPSSLVCLNTLKFLSFAKPFQVSVRFLFPQTKEGLRSLQILNLWNCNLIDGGLPEDIGCLSSLKELYLRGNEVERLPQSINQLGNLSLLDLADCKRLNELPELPPNIETLHVEFHMAMKSIHCLASKYKKLQRVLFISVHCEFDESDLFRCMSAVDSLCRRVIHIEHPHMKIASWLPHQAMNRSNLSVSLPGNWYVNSNFLGFSICCYGNFDEVTFELLPVSNDTMCDTCPKPEKLSKTIASIYPWYEDAMHFMFIPFGSLWDTSKANRATPNDYGHLKITTSEENGVIKEFGFRLLFKDETDHETLSPMRKNGDKSTEFFIGCSSSKKRKSPSFDICGSSLWQQVEDIETLHICPQY